MSIIGLHECRIILGLPEFLIRDFVSYEFNGRKLRTVAAPPWSFERFEALEFQTHLDAPWPGADRRQPPDHVKRYLKYESGAQCALCRLQRPNYEFAHIRAWSQSRSNNPHNLLHLCLDCHMSNGGDEKLLRGLKEELVRRIQLIDLSSLYVCEPNIRPGEAVYAMDGHAFRAHAAGGREHRAAGFVQTKIGVDRCTIQRTGVLVLDSLEVGQEYFLSPTPGRIVTAAEFDAARDMSRDVLLQMVGRAESATHLAIGCLATDFEIYAGVRVHRP